MSAALGIWELCDTFICVRFVVLGISDPWLVRSAIRGLLATGLDPFTRFISPEEFVAMRKYDVTGVGLNLAPAEDFERKIGAPLPPGRSVEVQTLSNCAPI